MTRAFRPVAALALMTLAAATGGSCRITKSCTEIGCISGLTIRVRSDHWPPGSYLFELTTDRGNFECRFEQGDPASEGAAGASGAASSSPVVGADRTSGGTTTSGTRPGAGVPPACVSTSDTESEVVPPGLFLSDTVEIGFQTTPSEVILVVFHDESEVRRKVVQPAYTRVFPNGRDCDEGCLQASEDVAITGL